MFTKKTLAIALAGALALGAFSGSALATPVNVAGSGVIIDSSSPINLTIDAVNFRESSVSKVGDVLTGYGKLASINGTDQSTFCPGCDVNFQFSYTVQSIDSSGANNKVVFDAGSINFYVDNTSSFNVLDPRTAGIGNLFLTLTGHTAPFTGYNDVGQLYSTVLGPVSNPGRQSAGFGLLDATGGSAVSYFDTNTQSDGSDFAFSSSFLTMVAKGCNAGAPSSKPDSLCHYPISGTGELTSSTPTRVPEPGAAGMLGLGLAALGLFARRRRNEANGRA